MLLRTSPSFSLLTRKTILTSSSLPKSKSRFYFYPYFVFKRIFAKKKSYRIEPTPQADLTHFYSSGDVESSSSDPVELDIIGVNGQCLTGPVAPRFGLQSALNSLLSPFNVTLQFTTTVTATLTLTTTVTSGSKVRCIYIYFKI